MARHLVFAHLVGPRLPLSKPLKIGSAEVKQPTAEEKRRMYIPAAPSLKPTFTDIYMTGRGPSIDVQSPVVAIFDLDCADAYQAHRLVLHEEGPRLLGALQRLSREKPFHLQIVRVQDDASGRNVAAPTAVIVPYAVVGDIDETAVELIRAAWNHLEAGTPGFRAMRHIDLGNELNFYGAGIAAASAAAALQHFMAVETITNFVERPDLNMTLAREALSFLEQIHEQSERMALRSLRHACSQLRKAEQTSLKDRIRAAGLRLSVDVAVIDSAVALADIRNTLLAHATSRASDPEEVQQGLTDIGDPLEIALAFYQAFIERETAS